MDGFFRFCRMIVWKVYVLRSYQESEKSPLERLLTEPKAVIKVLSTLHLWVLILFAMCLYINSVCVKAETTTHIIHERVVFNSN